MKKISKTQIIELGKIWMRNSINPNHNYVHASEVQKHALEVHKEIGECIDINLVLMAVWWHDSYKSRQKTNTLYAAIFEGKEASKIFREQFEGKLEKKELELVCDAIFNHNSPPIIISLRGQYNVLNQILIEADNIDSLSLERYRQVHKRYPHWLLLLLIKLYKVFVDVSSLGVRKSRYYLDKFRIF